MDDPSRPFVTYSDSPAADEETHPGLSADGERCRKHPDGCYRDPWWRRKDAEDSFPSGGGKAWWE